MSYEFLTRSQAASKLRTSITGGGEGSEFITKTMDIIMDAIMGVDVQLQQL